MIPTLRFFREGYKFLDVKFNYHVEVNKEVDKEERKNDFQIELIIELEDKPLIRCEIGVGFGRNGEMNTAAKLSARYKFHMEPDFNERIVDKMKKN